MGVLESVIKMRQIEDAKARADVDAIAGGVNAFIQSSQAAQALNLQKQSLLNQVRNTKLAEKRFGLEREEFLESVQQKEADRGVRLEAINTQRRGQDVQALLGGLRPTDEGFERDPSVLGTVSSGSVLDVLSQDVSPGEKVDMLTNLKLQSTPAIETGDLEDITRIQRDRAQAERVEREATRRDMRFRFTSLMSTGGGADEETLDLIEQELGQDLRPQLEAGRGVPSLDEKGNRRWRVLSDQEWQRKVSQGKFAPTEIEHLQNTRAEHRAWTNVLNRLESIGINPETAGKVEFDTVNSPIGPLSIPARFNIVAQFKQDPRYTSVKRDIELAFQAFRKRVTGAQASDRELRMLRPLLASLTDRPQVFFETIRTALENTEIAFEDRVDIYARAGRDVSQFENFFQEQERTSKGKKGQPKSTAKFTEGQTARNPQTGEVLIFRGGKWQKR